MDTVFKTAKGMSVMRSLLESLFPRVTLHITVLSAWADLLNDEERFRKRGIVSRLFCSVNMLVSINVMRLFIIKVYWIYNILSHKYYKYRFLLLRVNLN
ncbi:hypothetical protein Hanom_Chr13g01197171 [Helianthus anomalus]